MAAEIRTGGKRKRKNKNKEKPKKAHQLYGKMESKRRVNDKLKKLYKKRAKEYNSDDESLKPGVPDTPIVNIEEEDGSTSEGEALPGLDRNSKSKCQDVSEVPKFTEGCKAFKMAFLKIMKSKASDDALGPVLSSHKKLLAEKFADEEADRKAMVEAKKKKQLIKEKGHVKPATFLDTKEKFLLSLATKGVVKLFNAVSKAQSARSGSTTSSSKAARALAKRRRQTLLSELRKPLVQGDEDRSVHTKDPVSTERQKSGGLGWAPLRDNYFLTGSKLKDWDKRVDSTTATVSDQFAPSSSSDEDM